MQYTMSMFLHVYPSSKLTYDESPQEGFSMHMYGGRESLKRDCHGHYFFSSNVKLTQDRCLSLRPDDLKDRRIFNDHYQLWLFFVREDLSVKFLGLERQHHLQVWLHTYMILRSCKQACKVSWMNPKCGRGSFWNSLLVSAKLGLRCSTLRAALTPLSK